MSVINRVTTDIDEDFDKAFASTIADWLPHELAKRGLTHLLNQGYFVEFGCGTGGVVAELQRRYPDVPMIGIDCDRERLTAAESRNSGAHFIRARLEHTPLIDESVPLAFSSRIYQLENEHRYAEIIQEIHRILKSGAVYFVVDRLYERFTHAFAECGFKVLHEDSLTAIYQKR